MYTVGTQTWTILFSLTLMSHLYKGFFCESIVHTIDTKTREDSEQRLSQGSFYKVFFPGRKIISGKSEHAGDDGLESKQHSMRDLVQMSNEKFMSDLASERKRRQSADQQQSGSKCQRHKMDVNFNTIGWGEMMIAPSGYNAYYCAGECPLMPIYSNYIRHARIQSLMNLLNPNIPKPCCVPITLSSLQVLYTVNSIVYNEMWNNMIVEECGCR